MLRPSPARSLRSCLNRQKLRRTYLPLLGPLKKKGAAKSAAPPSNRRVYYLPFLPPLSSFLPFFFIRSSFCSSADGRRCRRLITKLEVYERATRVSRSIRSASRKISLLRRGAGNFARVIAVARLDGEPFAFHADLQLMDLRGTIRASGHVRERVLVPRFFADARV